ncbi:hypothetical protein [Rheinheimera soli]|uniref:hypothetical protein n=1 Tax=Rheinheimera soli TaxID=443616 RepID=UPI001E40FC85|nr:hypothetical protein [Rheinheimera soli]
MKNLKAAISCALITVLSACESTMEKPEALPIATNSDKEGIIAFPAEVRSVYVRNAVETNTSGNQYLPKYDDNGKLVGFDVKSVTFIKPKSILCAEPAPDTSVSSSAAFAASANLQMTETLSTVSSAVNTLAQTVSTQASRINSVGSDSSNRSNTDSGSVTRGSESDSNVQSGGTSNDLLSASGNVSRTANELAGRDNVVLLTRETYFRLCEAFANGAISRDDYGRLHQETMHQITSMLDTKKAIAKAAEAEAETKKAEAEVKLAEAKRKLLDAQGNSLSVMKQAALQSCGTNLVSCTTKADADPKAVSACNAIHQQCIKDAGGL